MTTVVEAAAAYKLGQHQTAIASPEARQGWHALHELVFAFFSSLKKIRMTQLQLLSYFVLIISWSCISDGLHGRDKVATHCMGFTHYLSKKISLRETTNSSLPSFSAKQVNNRPTLSLSLLLYFVFVIVFSFDHKLGQHQ